MLKVSKIILHYLGYQIDYEYTTYFPNGLVDKEKGVPAVLVLTDKGEFNISFFRDNYKFNFSNVLNFLKKDSFSSIVNDEIELMDTSGISGELFLNGEIIEKDENLEVINYSEKKDNDWTKIGERDAYETLVQSSSNPFIKIVFEDSTFKEYSETDDAIFFIQNLNLS